MTVSIPLIALVAVIAYACWRYMGLKLWHLLVCILLGVLLAAGTAGPQILAILNAALLRWGHQ